MIWRFPTAPGERPILGSSRERTIGQASHATPDNALRRFLPDFACWEIRTVCREGQESRMREYNLFPNLRRVGCGIQR